MQTRDLILRHRSYSSKMARNCSCCNNPVYIIVVRWLVDNVMLTISCWYNVSFVICVAKM